MILPTESRVAGTFDMLSRAIIRNFKSIAPGGVDVELKPLTILVGPNGGGSLPSSKLYYWPGMGEARRFEL